MNQSLLRTLNNLLRILKVTLTTGWISIFIIGLVVILLTQVEQGSALLVSLLNSPVNIFLFMVLIIALMLVIGHYPIYLMMWRRDHSVYRTYEESQQPVSWNMQEIVAGLGWISFREEDEKRSNTFLFRQVNYVRGILGLSFIFCLSLILNHAIQAYIYPNYSSIWISLFILFLLILLHSGLNYYKYHIYALPRTYNYMTNSILVLFWGATLSAGGAILSAIAFDQGWNPYTFTFFIIHWLCVGLLYCFFKNFRSELKYIKALWPISLLGHHLTFVKFNTALGGLAFLIFILSQFTTLIHPLVILISFLHLIYGVFIVILKHRFYYISNPPPNGKKVARIFFLYITPVILPALLLITIFAGTWGNNLHLLKGTEKQEVLGLNTFKNKFYAHIDTLDISDSTLYFIASYGGGLKANAWNLMVLDSLSNFKGHNILDQTVAMSGVSGGALGQHFHASLERQGPNAIKKNEIIHGIAQSNMLSLDISWLLGYDFIRERLPFTDFTHPDRAGKAMEMYARILEDPFMDTEGYQSYWARLFDASYYPIQIANATGVNQRRGIACSVELDRFSHVFPNADDLCDLPNYRTLTFSEAVSTSNRFPILSPAAKVQGKGHYVDGGYFENSGMLSLLDLFIHLNQDTAWSRQFKDWTVAFVQIRNNKKAYLRSKLKINTINIAKIEERNELYSIIDAFNSTQHLPVYIEERMENFPFERVTFSAIDLPYRITDSEVKNILKAKEIDLHGQIEIDSIIQQANSSLQKALSNHPDPEWGVIEPPLGRFLSQPAVEYMKTMIKHEPNLFSDFQSCREINQ